jgi:hypothetical protein
MSRAQHRPQNCVNRECGAACLRDCDLHSGQPAKRADQQAINDAGHDQSASRRYDDRNLNPSTPAAQSVISPINYCRLVPSTACFCWSRRFTAPSVNECQRFCSLSAPSAGYFTRGLWSLARPGRRQGGVPRRWRPGGAPSREEEQVTCQIAGCHTGPPVVRPRLADPAGMSARHRTVSRRVSSWPGWPSEHRHSTRRVGRQAVLAEVIDLTWVNPRGRGIGGDSLATKLVIDRRLTHGTTL